MWEKGLWLPRPSVILDVARLEQRVVVTLDADFHALLVLSGADGPSVIRIRLEGLRAGPLAGLLIDVLKLREDDLSHGAMVSATEHGVRVRLLPLHQ
jgi:predicted nuclease of predicted toxin-antitoxin system